MQPSDGPTQLPVTPGAPDWTYIAALVGLISAGMIMAYSASAAEGGSFMDNAKWLVLSLPFLFAASHVPMRVWRKFTPVFLIGTIVALASLEIPGNPLAKSVLGATRWIRLPGGNQIQPSEFAKLAFVLFSAHFLDRQNRRNRPSWLSYLVVLGSLGLLIYKEPDLGTALVLGSIAFCMLVAGGIPWRTLFSYVAIAAVLVFVLAWNTPHQKARLLAWWNPWAEQFRQDEGRQVIQSWIAMARGGWTGVGLGQSTQKLANRLPESETDFIFAIVSEELGLLRAAGVLGLFGLLAWRGYTVAARAPDRYSSLVVSGITSWIAAQSCINIAVVTGTIPNTGVPLPFLSQGGSSFLALMISVGIVIGVSRQAVPRK